MKPFSEAFLRQVERIGLGFFIIKRVERGNSKGILMLILLVVALMGMVLFLSEFMAALNGETYDGNKLAAGVILLGVAIAGEAALAKS